MSTYHSIWWLPLCGGLTGLGLVLSYLVMRRRGVTAGLRGVAWSLLPLAAYLTGSTEMFWKMGVAIGDFAKGFAFSSRVWSGVAVAGLSFVLFVASGGVRRRRRVKAGQDAGPVASGGARSGRGTVSATGTLPALPATKPGGLAVPSAAPAAATAPAQAKLPRRAKAAAAADSGDDDMRDVEEILRRRGIS